MGEGPLQIAFLTTGLDYGGAETQLVRLVRYLAKHGWVVRVVSMLRPRAFILELQEVGVEVVSLEMQRGRARPQDFVRALNILRDWQPPILTCFQYHANLLGRSVGKFLGIPVVISSVRNENFGGELRKWSLRLTDRWSTLTVVNSQRVARSLVQQRVVSEERVRVIPNGVDLQQYRVATGVRNRMRQTLGIQERDFLWLAIGRQEPQKDYPNLLDAFGRIVSPETHLLIVGKRTMQEELAALVEQKELQEQVTFLGLRRDIPALLAAADALVLASAWEGLPNVVMEALAAAVPVVATAVGGVPELVVEGESGYLVPPRNPQALASAMVRLMGHSNEERVRMGEAGRGHILSGFEISVVMVVWEDMMHGLLKGREVKC